MKRLPADTDTDQKKKSNLLYEDSKFFIIHFLQQS